MLQNSMDKLDQTEASVDAAAAHKLRLESQGFILDVRGFDEFATGHAEGAICIPLPDLERRAGEIPTDRPVLVICQSGRRSALGRDRLLALGMNNVVDVAGGFNAWHQAGLPSIKHTNTMPLERQVRIAAGAMVLGFSIAGFVINHAFFFGAALIGFMLTLTGALGICPMMSVLKLLPWNRTAIACKK